MQPDLINKESLLKAIRTFQTGRKPPAQLLKLQLLNKVKSEVAKALLLRQIIYKFTEGELNRHRHAACVEIPEQYPGTIPDVIEHFCHDVTNDFNYMTLCYWSALYHRYIAPVTATSKLMAEEVGVDQRTCNRWIESGVDLLVPIMQYAELQARDDDQPPSF